MAFYKIYGGGAVFEEFYNNKRHLYDVHKKDFEENHYDEYLELANTFHPSDFDEWLGSLGKLFKYEKELYAKVDRHYRTIIMSYYSMDPHGYDFGAGLVMRFIYDTSKSRMYHYRMKNFKNFVYVLNSCDGRVQMGGWTDYDRFYTQYQRKLDDKSIDVLKSLEQFKYLPIEKFNKIGIYNLFQVNEDTIYQYEILLKSGLIRLATDLMMERDFITTANFKRFKTEIMGGIKYKDLQRLINETERRERERIERLEKAEQIKLFNEMPKQSYDMGEFILKHPNTFKELEREGRELHHCVARYLEQIVTKDTDVMLLRKKDEPDTPFFTVEIRQDIITQVRTMKNQTDPEITGLIKDWWKKGRHYDTKRIV